MKERSATTSPGTGVTCSRVRTLTRSSTVTRGSVRSDQASCPYPTSAATTCAAPARSSTSVNPPVDAPASRQARPATVRPAGPNTASAPASLCPPRETYPGSPVSAMLIGASRLTWVAALAARCPATVTRPAATSSPACSRDLARPRLTSSASSRTRVAVTACPR